MNVNEHERLSNLTFRHKVAALLLLFYISLTGGSSIMTEHNSYSKMSVKQRPVQIGSYQQEN